MGKRREPRWVVPFLRALERTGEARQAAEDAGIDHTTAYDRRKRYEDFGDAWDAAVYKYGVAKEAREAEELDPSTIASSGNGSPPETSSGRSLLCPAGS